jgi:geranylgeranyl diphosphate synthase type II
LEFVLNFLKENIDLVEKEIDNILLDARLEPLIKEAMVYVLKGGKKIRASLLIEAVKSIDKNLINSDLIKIAMAIEMIHAYSLVHDDLPALDNDDYRRGKLTLHKKYNEALAILTGDALLTHAFTIISETNYKKDIKFDILQKLASASGPMGMIYGQIMDMEYEIKDLSTLKKLHSLKTGKMLILPIEIAIIITECDEDMSYDLLEYAKSIGVAFQAVDDLLDVIGIEDKMGKTLHKDELQDKVTYIDMLGVENTKVEINNLINKALESIKKYNLINLERIASFIGKRDY